MNEPLPERACACCAQAFRVYRPQQRFCCDRCRNKAFRDERAALLEKARELLAREGSGNNGETDAKQQR